MTRNIGSWTWNRIIIIIRNKKQSWTIIHVVIMKVKKESKIEIIIIKIKKSRIVIIIMKIKKVE